MKQNSKFSLSGSKALLKGKRMFRALPLMAAGLIACTFSARAADSPGVKFNSGVRYSQWAIDSRLYDFYGNKNQFGFAKWDASSQKLGSYTKWSSPKNDYVAGLVGKATLEAAEFYNTDWSKPWFESAKGYALDNINYSSSSDAKNITLDNMNAAKMFIPLTKGNSEWITATEQNSAKNYINEVIKDLVTYNSELFIGSAFYNSSKKWTGISADKANELGMYGSWYHKPDYVDQTWCDGMYMGPALLAQIIKYNGKTNNLSASDNDWDILAKQFTISWKQLHDGTTGLMYHGFTANPGVDASADWAGVTKGGTTYHSASFWGRANAWYFMALVDVLEAMPADNSNYTTLKGYLTSLASAIKKYQDSETGCWYQVLDKTPVSLTGNYLEASCSSIFTAAYLKAIRLGLLDKATYEPVAKKAYEGLVNQFMVYDNTDNNTVQLVHSCTSAGLGNGRAGDDDYYINGTSDAQYVTSADPNGKVNNKAMYYTEGKVLGGFIMAATEYERAYQNQDTKQILFARDLAPEYDFSTTEGTLDATAYGSATPTYQWYKDGSAIADATSSTYSPTESGTYKCTATANGTTITTSEAVVTAKANTGGEEKPTTNSTLFEYTFPTSGTGTDTELANYGTISYNSITFDANGCALKDDKKYVQIALKNNTIKEGDIITVKTYSTSGETSGIIAKAESNGATTICSVTSKNTTETSSYTVKASDAIVGSSILKLFRNTKTTYLSYIKITRAGSDTPTTKKYAVTASVNPAEGGNMYIYNGDEELTSGDEVESGTNVKFSVSTKDGYVVTGWTVNGVTQSTPVQDLSITITEATTVVANVEQRCYVYGTTKNGGSSSSVAIECNGKAVEHGATLPKGSTVKFTATPAQGYKFVKWVNGDKESEELGTSNPLVVENLSKDFNACAVFEEEGSGTVTTTTGTFSLDDLKTLDSTPSGTEKSEIALNDGYVTVKAGNKIRANTGGIKISSSDKSTFSIVANNGAKIKSVTIEQDQSKYKLSYNPEGTESTPATNTFKYDYSSSKPTEITISYNPNNNVYVKSIIVEYEYTSSTPKTDLKATYAAQSIDATVGDVNLTAPELTVMAGETALTAEQYAVSYASSATDVVRVEEDGSLTAAHKGTATITATITPVDGTKYNSTTATFTVKANARQLKASFSPAAVDAKVDDEARALPTLSVIDVKTNQPVSEFTATYTSNDENVVKIVDNKLVFTGVGKTTVKATVTPTLQTVYDGCEATFEVSVAKKQSDIDPTKDNVVYDFLHNVGTEVAGVSQIKITEGGNIMFGTNFKAAEGKYLTVGADGDGGFKAGDVVTIKGYCPKKNSGILIYANPTDAEPQFQSPAFSATEVTYTFTVQKDCDKLYFGRFGGSSTYVTGLTIVRPGTTGEKIRLTAAFAKNSDVIINKTDNYTIDMPALTVMAGEEELAADQYSVVYTSNDEAIASVAEGKITVKTTGTATILATVTPKDANKYEGCTATYTITVKEQTALNISVNDVNINVTDANYKQPIIKVYGDDDKLLTLDTDYTLSYSIEGTNVSVENGMLKVAGEKYKWTEGTSTITVTATPTESLGETFKAGTMTFLYNVVKGKLTPAFLASFTTTDDVIKIKKYDSKTNKNDKKFRVPLIYDGEDVSEYFKYTYKVTKADGAVVTNKNNNTNGNEFTFRPDTEGDFTISVSATPMTDKDDYSEVYNTPAAISFKVNVSPDYIRPVITFNPETVQMYTGTTEGAPDVIVTDGTKELEEGTAYSLKWISFTPSFVKVDEESGKLEAVNEGNGSVRVTVKGDNLETMTAFLTVYVDDPAVYRAKDKDNDGVAVAYGNQKQMWNQDRTLSVTLGGWMFPNDVTEGLTYDSNEGLSKKYKWADKASQPKWKMSGFNRFVSGESSRNARQEDGSNAQVNTTMISTADFKTKGTVVDRMFNVPCSGSYLVFNPATNGTVNVHIFQNGVFDSGVYRPQRRVFVMDEQGNFVKSTPEIENANGKPTGGLKALSNFKWDINPNGANTAPTIEQVRSHFKDIPADFDMTEEKFQNNVLESNLPADIVPNAAYDKDVEGSNGWCVLADSPVTYTFNVKAGKTYYLWNFGSKIGFYGFSFEEDATKPKIDDVTYDEAATTNIIKSTKAGYMAKVSINRKLKAGIWNTCVLPFSLNKHQVDALFGDTYMMGCENGTQILYFDHVDANGKVWFVRHAYNTIVANKPFLIKPTKNVEVINTADCADYPYVTIEAPDGNKPADWCSDGKYAWVSSYNNDMTLAEGDGYIGGTSGSFIQSTKSDVKVKGFRGYLKGLTPEAKAHALSTATSSNTEENGSTTFIEGLTIDAEGNIVPVATDGKVYNINGQVVADGMKNLNALPSGVYIINGKKYVK